MVLAQEALTGGFENPVFDAQSVFREVMDAMARPGTVRSLAVCASAPAGLSPAQAAIALCLADHDTPVWLSPRLRGDAVSGWVTFHCGAPATTVMSEAHFAFLASGEPLPDFSGFNTGSQDYPDRSATLVAELPSLVAGQALVARGPGIKNEHNIALSGLPADFAKRWQMNRALFPRGIDLILTSGSQVLCLPRTTILQAIEG